MKLNISILFLLFVFSVISFSQQTYVNDDYGFTINFPDGWKIKKGDTEFIVVSASSSDKIEINIGRQGSGGLTDSSLHRMGLEQFVSAMEEHFKDSYQGYKTLSYGETKIDSLYTYYISYNISDEKAEKMHGIQYFFINKKRLYVITEGCPEALFITYEDAFKKSAESFHFIK